MPSPARPRRGDLGAATTVTVLVVPIVMLCILLGVQIALAYHARHIAEAAAADAAHAAAAYGAAADAGATTAKDILTTNATQLLDDVSVSVAVDADRVRVVITGTVENVVPGLDLRVSGTGEAPVERFRPGSEP